EEGRQDLVLAVKALAVLGTAVIAILVTALESLPEVVVVLRLIHVHARVAVVGVAVGPGIPVVESRAVFPVRLSGPIALLLTAVPSLRQLVGAVLARLVVVPAVVIAIGRSRVEVRVAAVVVRLPVLCVQPLLAKPLVVLLLEAVPRHLALLLVQLRLLLGE